MSKVLIIDPYKKVDYRISKDTSGGYGTGNDFGDGFISSLLKNKLKFISEWPPLHSAYTYSVLKKKNLVKYKKIFSFDEITRKELSEYDFYIIVSSIVCSKLEVKIIKELNKIKKTTIAIGPFASENHKDYLLAGANVISGEPEIFFFNEDINNITFEPKILFTNKNINLDDLPFPEWQEIMKLKSNKLYGNYNSVPILATRGCPYSCFRYCVYPLQQGRVVRQRSPNNIFQEILFWNLNYKVKLFVFRDPVFSINKKHTIELCNLIINSNIKIKFVIETHLRILDDELINLMKAAGLTYVKVGIENASSEILDKEKRFTIKKDHQLEKIIKLKNKKIQVSAMYILGFPSDDKSSVIETIKYAIKLNTCYAQFSIWTPYPGTPAFQEYQKILTSSNYEDFDQYRLVYNHKNLSPENLRSLLSLAYHKYYLRLGWIVKYLLKKINLII